MGANLPILSQTFCKQAIKKIRILLEFAGWFLLHHQSACFNTACNAAVTRVLSKPALSQFK